MSTFDEHDEPFGEQELKADPLELFNQWYQHATKTSPGEWYVPNAMNLATVDAAQRPHARTVLLKEVDGKLFRFFTNYQSAKGGELSANPSAALTFYWPHLYRQVRIEGDVRKTAREVSEAYFHSRPRGSQINAYASPQSHEVKSRAELEQLSADVEARYPEGEIHADHLGDTERLAKTFDATVIAMFEICAYLGARGVERMEPMNIGGTIDHDSLKITMVNALHSSAIVEDGKPMTMGDPAGIVIKSPEKTVYHAGDTDIFSDMALIQRLHQPQIGLIPIGDRFTMGPKKRRHLPATSFSIWKPSSRSIGARSIF